MIRIVIALACMIGCAAPEPTRASLWLDISPNAGAHAPYLTAARAWEVLGFESDDADPGLPLCAPHDRSAGCELHVTLERAPYPTQTIDGMIVIDDREVDPARIRIGIAHEVGHNLLDTGDHAPGGQLAIMNGTWSAVTDIDRTFACAHREEFCDP